MKSRIEQFGETKLIGRRISMSFANNKTRELWQGFMLRRGEIKNAVGRDLFSVEIFHDPSFFRNFNPAMEFEKWAAVKVTDHGSIPDGMEPLIIPAGPYAVFNYKGKPSEAQRTYQYIYTTWLPNSEFILDDRPHLAIMGEKYKGENPDSEEELWIPVKNKY